MIRRKEECAIEKKEHMRGGNGVVYLTSFIGGPEDLNGKGRLFSKIHLDPGCGIGVHEHEGESELFYIMQGVAEYNDNGVVRTVTAGDVTICRAGESHGISNKSCEVVELVAVILYADS